VVLTLALGMGATTAVFTIVNGVLFRPLPYPEPDRLVSISMSLHGERDNPFAYVRDYVAWRLYNRTLSQLAGYMDFHANFAGKGEAEWVAGGMATASLFPMLGVRPAWGRNFLPAEDRPGGAPVAILEHAFWKRRFGGDVSVIGKPISLDDQSYTVVGVLPPGFRIPSRYTSRSGYDVWIPFVIGDSGKAREFMLQAIGRRKPGFGLEAARGDLNALLKRAPWPRSFPRSIVVTGWHEQIAAGARAPLLLFLGAVACVLLIVCVNVANLLLARAVSRQREVAMRRALGAGRARIVRQLLAESVTLGLMGSALGLAFASWLKDLLLLWIAPKMPALDPIGFDWRVLLFGAALGLITGILFGLAPAWSASGVHFSDTLKESGRGVGEGPASRHFGSILAAGEVALATVLVSGAGLLLNSFLRLSNQSLGFRTDHVLAFDVSLPGARYPKPIDRARFLEQSLERIQRVAGVESAAGGEWLPLTNSMASFETTIERHPGLTVQATDACVSPGYFRTLGIPIVRGRDFSAADREGAPSAVMVNEAFVRKFLPHENPLGARMENPNREHDWATIVGVAGDVRSAPGESTAPEIYLPSLQPGDPPHFNRMGDAFMTMVVRAAGDPKKLAPSLRGQIAALDAGIPLHTVATLDELRSESIAPRGVSALLIGAFAALALLLGSIGVYGVMAYSVGRRTHEIGVRMALGAEQGKILGMVLRKGLALIGMGIGCGLLASLGATRWLASELWGVSAGDPLTLTMVALVLMGCGLAACVVPARHAARVDPISALRCE
jgi:putative ABC transport system permease protein